VEDDDDEGAMVKTTTFEEPLNEAVTTIHPWAKV
jgi:hypothetical protein